jgi:arginase
MRNINFLGLGFEIGQTLKGLKESHLYTKKFFPALFMEGLKINDCGEVNFERDYELKVQSNLQFQNVDWAPYEKAYNQIKKLLKQPETLLNWGGDHSIALSTVGAFTDVYPDGHVLWIDAHADMNLPLYSPTGNLHGMPMSALLNLQNIKSDFLPWNRSNLSVANFTYLGVRDLDPFEKQMLQDLKIETYSAEDIRNYGMPLIAKTIFEKVKNKPMHISFDIDSLSPAVAPSTGVRVSDGLTLEDLRFLAQAFSLHRKITSLDIVEINPKIGSQSDVHKTYLAALEFVIQLLSTNQVASKKTKNFSKMTLSF